jgi:hypothetical protein
MDIFKLSQNRFSVTTELGSLGFRIDISCEVIRDVNSNVILTPDVFVYSTDGTLEADTSSGGSIDGSFLRVATIADLGALPVSKEDAVARGLTEYRLRVLQLSMPDLETATNAIPVVVDRVNALVDAYIDYQNNFYSVTPTVYDLPRQNDESVVNQYTTAYSNSVLARESGEAEQSSLQAAYQSLQVKNEILSGYASELSAFKDTLMPVVTELNTHTNSVVALAASPTVDLKTALAKTSFSLESKKNLLEALATNRATLLTGSLGQEASALSQLKDKQDEVAALEAAEAQALSALATYCPQIDPTAITGST